jgi:hypothetical protein
MTNRGTWIGVGTVLAAASVVLIGWYVFHDPPGTSPVARPSAAAEEQSALEPTPLTAIETPAEAPAKVIPESTRAPAMAEENELDDALWVEGRVLFPAGTPPDERAVVVAKGKRFETFEYHRVPVEPDGSFRVAFHPQTARGRLALEARYLHVRPRRLNFPELPRPVPPITLEPELGAWLTGVLVPPEGLRDDDPFPESVYVIVNFDGRNRKRYARLDGETFAFDFGAVPAGAPDAHRRSPTYEFLVRPPLWLKLEQQVPALEVAEHRHVELPMQLGAQVLGRVVDEEGKGVEASISLTSIPIEAAAGNAANNKNATSSTDGQFFAYGVPPGRVAAVARAKGYVGIPLELGPLDDGGRVTDVTLLVERGPSISGSVVWPDGSPATGATVRTGKTSATVQADGQFALTGLGPGKVRVNAWGQPPTLAGEPPLAALERRPWRTSAEIDVGSSNVVLVLTSGATLRGTVSDEDGQPVDDFSILCFVEGPGGRRTEVFSDALGIFSIDGLQEGHWRIRAQGTKHSSGPAVRVAITGREARVDLTIFNRAGLAGTVVDSDGVPVWKAGVSATVDGRPHGLTGRKTESTRTSKDGTFELSGLQPGSVTLRVKKVRYIDTGLSGIDLLPGERRDGLRLELNRGGRVEGLVRGLPAGSITEVRLRPTRSAYKDSTEVGADGRFVFQQVAEDTYRVVLQVEGLPPTEVEAHVREDETAHVVLAVETSGLVRVHGVVRRRSEGVPRIGIAARGDGGHSTARSDEDGSYELFVAPGEHSFFVQGHGSTTAREIEVPETAEFHLDLELPEGSIGGRVDRQNNGAGGVQITLTGELAAHESTIFGPEFRFDDLDAGRYRIDASMALNMAQTYVSAPTFVELGQNQKLDGVVLVLKEPGHIVGHVTDSAGLPMIGTTVFARPVFARPGNIGIGSWERTSSDATGRFQFGDLGPAEWTVAVFKDGSYWASSSVVVQTGSEARVDLVASPP